MDLYAEIHLVLLDSFTSKATHGALSKVGEKLWRDWLTQVKEKGIHV